MDKKGFCYGSGDEDVPIAELHQGKIRHSGDKAKIISANDDINYTYRGRFTDASEACQIGAEISYKAHNALRWLIHTQGTYLGNGLTVVAWCSAAIMIPSLIQNSITAMTSLDNDLGDEEYDSSQVFARALRSRLRGYYGNISKKDHILVMVLNAATTGRMSILLYREFAGSDFCGRIEDWHTHLSWFYTHWQKEEKRYIHTISAPSPIEIAETAYGMHLNDDTKSMAVKRILPCILDGAIIPSDIANLCFSRASSLNTIKERFEREKVLETACAVIKYNGRILQKEDYQVGLDKERRTRDYLFGRLLAVADRIESKALSSRGEDRETNAIRYIQRFSKYPCSTWNFLEAEKLPPYIAQLKNSWGWFRGIIDEIMDKFDPEEYKSDKALTGEFLLGYHCQLKAFWDDYSAKKAAKDDPANNTEED
jgi:CRISPR-associated protein Csd1